MSHAGGTTSLLEQSPVIADPPMEGNFRNETFDWLTYESVFNKRKFRKSNQRRRLGFYILNLSSMQIWIREHLEDDVVTVLTEAFCPDSELEDIRGISDSLWKWKGRQKQPVTIETCHSPATGGPAKEQLLRAATGLALAFSEFVKAARSTAIIHRGIPRVVMPYNYWDNQEASEGLGTDRTKPDLNDFGGTPVGPPRQLKTNPESDWWLWKTASRSSVMQIGRVISKHSEIEKCEWAPKDWQDWPWKAVGPGAAQNAGTFEKGAYRSAAGTQTEREWFKNKLELDPSEKYKFVNPRFLADVQSGDFFKLNSRNSQHFSIKTGVCYVGFEDQKAAHKDIIGDWIVGSLRSDYVAEVHSQVHGWQRFQDLLVQTELFALVEKPSGRCDNSLIHGQDGVAVRDLSILLTDRVYLPPLSIPMIGKDHQLLVEEFSLVEDPEWSSFWKQNYAEALGKAKALFLLRYGLQHGNPNVQNYLLEFSKTEHGLTGSARVLIRDLQDAALHREVIWALYGNEGELPPPEDRNSGGLETAYSKLTALQMEALKYQFAEFKERDLRAEETGSTNPMFGPPGTQLGWFRFSTFFSAEKLPKDLADQKRPAILARMLEWGFAHAVLYVRTVEECLGVNLWKVTWTGLPTSFEEGKTRYSGQPDKLRGVFRQGSYSTGQSGALTVKNVSPLTAGANMIRDLALKKDPQQESEYKTAEQDLDQRLFGKSFTNNGDRNQKIVEYQSEPSKLLKLLNSPLYVAGCTDLSMNKSKAVSQLALQGLPPEAVAIDVARSGAPEPVTQTLKGGPTRVSAEQREGNKAAWLALFQEESFAGLVNAARTKKEQLLQQPNVSTLDSAIKAWYEKQYGDLYASLDQKHGYSDWDAYLTIRIFGTGFTDQCRVTATGYTCLQSFCESDKSLLCGFTPSEGLKDEVRYNTLIVTVTCGDASATLGMNLEGDLPWEENIGTVVHSYLKSAEGQLAIRHYRSRKWEPATPTFRITIVNWERAPMACELIPVRLGDTTHIVPTDAKGEIPFFGDQVSDNYQFPEHSLVGPYTYMPLRGVRLTWTTDRKTSGASTFVNKTAELAYILYSHGRSEQRNLNPEGVDVIQFVPGMQCGVEKFLPARFSIEPGQVIQLQGDSEQFGEGVGWKVHCEFLNG